MDCGRRCTVRRGQCRSAQFNPRLRRCVLKRLESAAPALRTRKDLTRQWKAIRILPRDPARAPVKQQPRPQPTASSGNAAERYGPMAGGQSGSATAYRFWDCTKVRGAEGLNVLARANPFCPQQPHGRPSCSLRAATRARLA